MKPSTPGMGATTRWASGTAPYRRSKLSSEQSQNVERDALEEHGAPVGVGGGKLRGSDLDGDDEQFALAGKGQQALVPVEDQRRESAPRLLEQRRKVALRDLGKVDGGERNACPWNARTRGRRRLPPRWRQRPGVIGVGRNRQQIDGGIVHRELTWSLSCQRITSRARRGTVDRAGRIIWYWPWLSRQCSGSDQAHRALQRTSGRQVAVPFFNRVGQGHTRSVASLAAKMNQVDATVTQGDGQPARLCLRFQEIQHAASGPWHRCHITEEIAR